MIMEAIKVDDEHYEYKTPLLKTAVVKISTRVQPSVPEKRFCEEVDTELVKVNLHHLHFEAFVFWKPNFARYFSYVSQCVGYRILVRVSTVFYPTFPVFSSDIPLHSVGTCQSRCGQQAGAHREIPVQEMRRFREAKHFRVKQALPREIAGHPDVSVSAGTMQRS